MDKEIVQNFDINATNKKQVRLDAKIYSQDIESAVFHLSFSDNGTELNLDDSYIVTILSVFRDSGRKLLVDATIVDGEALFTFDNRLITNWDVVDSYVYLKKGIQTVDVNSFSFKVDVSKIDSVISDIKVYYIEDLEDLKAEYIKKMELINKDHQDFLDAYIDGLPNTEDLKGKAGTIDVIGIEVLEENEEPKVINSGTESSAKLTFQLPIGHQGIQGELNDLHAQTESNTSNIELKANSSDMTSLQSAMNSLQSKVEAFGITPENLVTIKSLLDAIANNASDSEVAELINSVNILTSNISLMSGGDYSPKANKTDLESLQSAVNNQSATISTKANQTDLDNLQTAVTSQGISISSKAEQSDLLITNQNVETAQTTANQAKTDAQTAMTKADEAQANSLPLTGNAVSASKLATPRKLGVSLQSSTYQNFDGATDVTNVGVSGVLPIANGGTGTSDGVINTIAYSWSADGTDGFTTVYPNLNLLNFNSGVTLGKYYGWTADTTSWLPYRAYFKKVKVTPNKQYTISANWSNTSWLNVYAFTNESDTTAVARYGSTGGFGAGSWDSNFVAGYTVSNNMTFTVPANVNYIGISYSSISTDILTLQALLNGKLKLEQGLIATPWMKSASEITINDYPKYVGFSNIIKPNKTYSDYKWLPMGLVSIDSATGLLKPAVMGIDYAQARPIGSVISNSSNSSSGYTTGTWQNIGSEVIGSTTIYYWKRTA